MLPPDRNPFSHLPDHFRIKWGERVRVTFAFVRKHAHSSLQCALSGAPPAPAGAGRGSGAQWLRPVIVLCPQPAVVVSPSAKLPRRSCC